MHSRAGEVSCVLINNPLVAYRVELDMLACGFGAESRYTYQLLWGLNGEPGYYFAGNLHRTKKILVSIQSFTSAGELIPKRCT